MQTLNEPASEELIDRRFSGVARIYGAKGLAKLRDSYVQVIGVGGVGSWVVESLARSAVGRIGMIDMDIVAESNVNRQLHALESNFGRDKVAVMAQRISEINPECKIDVVDDFVSRDNIELLIDQKCDWVIDCIDDFRTKAALINHCKRNKISVITIGGAGGQKDPSKVRCTDLSRTQHDVLLAKTRKLLRQDYRFARNPKRSFGVPCVYSDEQLVYPDGQGGLTPHRPSLDSEVAGSSDSSLRASNALNCAGGIGSITHVTATFGFFASGYVLGQLASE